ncbi:MAG: L,D-transpeptidase family protein [Rhodospirillales bacterium]|nr:L,D-transpeptidase family protein [Rhodospirillales bacterium]
MEIQVHPDGLIEWGTRRVRCALGRSGVTLNKREGDGATPAGRFALREVMYRADRLEPLPPPLPCRTIAPDMGWSDDPAHLEYNKLVFLPHAGGHEKLWREDALYDIVVVLGYNDRPPKPNLGSAIFMHVAKADFSPTEGCVALAKADLLTLLAECEPETFLNVIASV